MVVPNILQYTYSLMPIFAVLIKQSNSSGDDFKSNIANCTTPKLISTGIVTNVDSLVLAAEGMVVIKFKNSEILNAVLCLLAAYYAFNAQYPKGQSCGQTKNVYLFLEHILINKGKCSTVFPVWG